MRLLSSLITAVLLTGAALEAAAQPNDKFGKPDIVTLEVAPLPNPKQWVVGIFLENDEQLAAITVPLSFGERVGQYRLDSVAFGDTRTSYFGLQTTNSYDTLNRVLVGLLYTLGGDEPPLEPGSGLVARVFLTSLEKSPAAHEPPAIDSTFFPPYNRLELVTPSAEPIKPILNILVVEKPTEYRPAASKPKSTPGTNTR